MENLDTGTYTLTAIGEADGEVTYFGTQSGVNVAANQTTDATVPIIEFIPQLTSVEPENPIKLMTFQVEFSQVEGATTYKVEWESGDTGGFVNTTSTDVNVPVTVKGEIEFKVRAGNEDVDPDDAQESEPLLATVEGDGAANDQGTAPNLGSGTGTNVTVTAHNIAPATEEDWVFVNVVEGERLRARVRTESLDVPSALDPAITVFDLDGNVVAENDDIDRGTVESEVVHVPPMSGQHYIVVSSAEGSSTGHYQLTVQIDNNNSVSTVRVTPSDAIIVTDNTVLVTATPVDIDGERLFRPVELTSSDPAVPTIDQDGIVTGVANGQVVLTAENEAFDGHYVRQWIRRGCRDPWYGGGNATTGRHRVLRVDPPAQQRRSE